MKILMTGSTGLIGTALTASLTKQGHAVTPLRRGAAAAGTPSWDPAKGAIDAGALEGFDGVIHLAGESIAGLRWTAAKKRRIRDSRVEGTKLLCRALAGLSKPPRWFIGASAAGYYGDRRDEVLREDSGPGTGFLADVCKEWEAAAGAAAQKGIRVAHLRTGVVLSGKGGALAPMLLPFKLGLGGRLGSGRQYMPWIALEDVVGAVNHIIARELAGPFNLAGPEPATNAAFTAALGRALRRPTVFPVPAFAVNLALGEMARELLLSSQRAEPAALLKPGYRFGRADVGAALAAAVGKATS
jgi:uncharacterized protein (TIGR01777 family)